MRVRVQVAESVNKKFDLIHIRARKCAKAESVDAKTRKYLM